MDSSPSPITLSEADVRSLVRLLGRVAAVEGTLAARKRVLMEGLRRLVKADGWLWSVAGVIYEQNRPVSLSLLHGGLTAPQIAGWLQASQSNDPPAPEDAPLSRETLHNRHFTCTRQQMVPDEEWYSNPAVLEHRLAVGLDHFLYSIYPLPKQIFSCIGLFRRPGRLAFSDRDRQLAHILISEIPWLHHAHVPGSRARSVPQLPPRRREVLILLLDGHDRKSIAELLAIQPSTAKEHIEAVYAHFRVSSQVQLISRFAQGNGRD